MQLSTQFVEADVMSAGKLDYVAGLGTLCGRFTNFSYKMGREIAKFENVKSQKPGGSNCD
jgi:hypothetical protein